MECCWLVSQIPVSVPKYRTAELKSFNMHGLCAIEALTKQPQQGGLSIATAKEQALPFRQLLFLKDA